MSTEEIIEGNRLIAEFMGWEIKFHRCYHAKPYDEHPFRYEYSDINGKKRWTSIERLLFNSSFDWLMLVVEKIEAMDDYSRVRIEANFCIINETDEFSAIGDSKINAVWLAVIEFIQFYNTQTHNP